MSLQFERIAITGGSGRQGQYLTADLKDRCRQRILDIRPPGDESVEYRQTDVLDVAAMTQAFQGQDAVVHLAAVPDPRTSSGDETFRINVMGTRAVLEAAELAGVRRVILVSSDAALGLHYNPPGWGPQYLPVDDAHPLRPIEPYSQSKRVTEILGESYAARGRLEVLAIRPTHIVFPPEYPELRARGEDVHNYHTWSYVSPEDVAQGIRLALAVDDAPWRTFILSASDGLNTRPTLDMLRERFGVLPEIRKPEVFARNPCASVLDITSAREILGFVPTSDWRAMYASIV